MCGAYASGERGLQLPVNVLERWKVRQKVVYTGLLEIPPPAPSPSSEAVIKQGKGSSGTDRTIPTFPSNGKDCIASLLCLALLCDVGYCKGAVSCGIELLQSPACIIELNGFTPQLFIQLQLKFGFQNCPKVGITRNKRKPIVGFQKGLFQSLHLFWGWQLILH